MDPYRNYRETYKKAKLLWKNEGYDVSDSDSTSSSQEGEGVVTRQQAKQINKAPIENDTDSEELEAAAAEAAEASPEMSQSLLRAENLPEESQINKSETDENPQEANPIQEDSDNVLFNNDTLVAENDLVQVFVIKTFFKVQKKFNLEDHHYVLHFKKKTNKPILLVHVLDILEKAFLSVLQNVKSFYKQDGKNFVYLTLTQDTFNEFRTSPYHLQGNEAKDMVDHLMSNFNRFINSNSSLELLDKSFGAYIKVVSKIHLDNSTVQRKPVQLTKTVGAKLSNVFLPGGRISLETMLQKDCLTKSICFATLKLKNNNTYTKVKQICYGRKTKTVKNEGFDLLNHFQEEVCHACNISLIGPHEIDIVNSIANYLQIQIHIIFSMEGPQPSIQSFPAGNNYDLPRIYLQIVDDHINIIDNLRAFFTFYKKQVCFDCRKILNHQWRRFHRCPKIQNCFNCNGIIKTQNTIVVPNENVYFCNSQLPDVISNTSFNCPKCNLQFVSNECFELHKKFCEKNSKGWKCPDCGIFESTQTFQSKEELQKSHVCGIKKYRCNFCYQIKDDNHICQITKQEGHLIWPNMAFLHLAFKDFGCANCNSCYKLQKKYCDTNNITFPELFKSDVYSDFICDLHKNNTKSEEPNFISLYKEEERFCFQEYCFFDDNFKSPAITLGNFKIPYCETPKIVSKEPFKSKKTSQTVSHDFAKVLKSQFVKNEFAVDKFMNFICSENRMSNFTVVVSDPRTLLLILKLFVKLNITPNVFQDGQKVNFLEVSSLKIRFVHMNCYMKGSIFDLAKYFYLPFELKYFPNSWNKETFYNYVGNKPNLEDFFLFTDTVEDKYNKKLFWDQLTVPYNFNVNLIETIQNESQLFFLCCIMFLKQAFELQDLIRNFVENKTQKLEYIHPFGWKISSISGFTFAVYSYFFMNDFNMYSVMQPFVGNSVLSSRGEFEWTSWLNWKNFDLNILNAFNNPEGQKMFGKHFVDGYSPTSKTVYQYRGCQFHFHLPPDCSHYKNQDKNEDSLNPFGISLKKLKERDNKQTEILLKYYSFDIKEIKIIYECEWQKFKKENPLEIEAFKLSTNFQSRRPLMRLTPRATLRGGFIEVYRLKFTLIENPSYKLYFADANSLYSHIALKNVFPIGKYKVIINPDSLKNNIRFIDNHFYYNKEPMQGDAAHVKIKAPSNLFRPYLPFRLHDEYNHMALCRACLTKKSIKKCIHKANDNLSFTSCYQVTDLEKAVSLGYEILEWYELHHYSERKPLFQTFVQILASQKLKTTNIFAENESQNPESICDNINTSMKLKGALALKPNQINPNSSQKQLYKEMLNSFYGRFALHTNFTKHIFCRNSFEIEKYASNPDNCILDIIPITDDVCEIEIVTPSKIKPSLCGTLYLTAEINALARKFIYEEAEKIEKLNGIILSIDTDSLLYALPSNVPDPLIYSPSFGDFKPVLGKDAKIESFYSFGPRNYSITYKDSNNVYHHLLKVKGLSTKSSNNCNIITPELYKEFIDNSFKSEISNIYLPQLRKVVDKQTKKFHEILTFFNFGNDIHVKRFIIENDTKFITYPFGYKFH